MGGKRLSWICFALVFVVAYAIAVATSKLAYLTHFVPSVRKSARTQTEPCSVKSSRLSYFSQKYKIGNKSSRFCIWAERDSNSYAKALVPKTSASTISPPALSFSIITQPNTTVQPYFFFSSISTSISKALFHGRLYLIFSLISKIFLSFSSKTCIETAKIPISVDLCFNFKNSLTFA